MIKYTHYRDWDGYSNWIVASRLILEKAKEKIYEIGDLISEGCYRLNGSSIETQNSTGISSEKAWSLKIPEKSLEKIAEILSLPLNKK